MCYQRANPLIWSVADSDRTDTSQYCLRLDDVTNAARAAWWGFKLFKIIRDSGVPPVPP